MAEIHRPGCRRKKLIDAAKWWARGGPGSDIDEVVSDLREKGWSEEAIALEIEEAAQLAEPGLVWPENWPAAQVFERCEWTVHVGMSKPYYQGISPSEIESVCRLMRIPVADWTYVLDSVRLMANAAAPILNEDRG